jgi:hypothetical protein
LLRSSGIARHKLHFVFNSPRSIVRQIDQVTGHVMEQTDGFTLLWRGSWALETFKETNNHIIVNQILPYLS